MIRACPLPIRAAAVFCLSICAAIEVPAQTPSPAPAEEAAILAVVDRFMIAISTNDFALMAQLRAEGSVNVVERPQAGGTLVTRRPFAPDGPKPGNYKERYWDPVVHVRGSLAVVWTPYEFWRDGKTSHCGIDVFEMFKEQGTWRIGNMMWTVEPDACPALRPADPSRVRPKG